MIFDVQDIRCMSYMPAFISGLWRNPEFSTNCRHLLTEGTVPVFPNRPFALQSCRITFSVVIVLWEVPWRPGWRHYMPEPPKSV